MRRAVSWFDWQDKDPASDFLPFAFTQTIAEARRKVAGGQPTGESPNDIVGITGNTLAWKSVIKNCAISKGQGKFKWDKTTLTWNVYRSTWDYLVAINPRAHEELQLVPATRNI